MKKLFYKICSLSLCLLMVFSFGGCDILGDLLGGHEHTYQVKSDEQNHWEECSCGETRNLSEHEWNNGVEIVAPTYQTKGEKLYTCLVCAKTKTQEIPKLLPSVGNLSFHFMTLGNDNAGDCIYVKAGDNDILIDAGSRANSVDDIKEYVDQYVDDNTLEYVIITHADQDHIAGFGVTNGSIFDLYDCEIIIDFPLTDKTTQVYNRYLNERADEVEKGAKHFTALECWNESKDGAQKSYQLADGITMDILYNYYYENDSADENNYSVCVQFTHGSRKFLFTGDLEQEGEESLVEYNDLSQVDFYKAGHHGSKTSSNDCLLDVIQPKICVVTCVCGTDEYTPILANQFPTQAFIDRISKHTDKVYIPSMGDPDYIDGAEFADMNGDIIVSSDVDGVTVTCSNNDTLLKDTDWFKAERTCPDAWLPNE